jgi:hypothetical protein
MNKLIFISILLLTVTLTCCTSENNQSIQAPENETISFEIKNLNDQNYPDNPDIGYRSESYHQDFFEKGIINNTSSPFHWSFSFLTKESDTILLKNVDVSELIPTIPENIKSDEYLSYISCVNQEWNRNQVSFNTGEFLTTITTSKIVRVDLARNCLNAYLWEVILYVEEDGKVLPCAHGWFDFPHKMYAQLFEKKNNIPFAKYKEPLESWIDPVSKKVNLNLLRKVVDTIEVDFRNKSDEMYPLKAAREKKYKEIIYPDTFLTMRDLQSDSTLFATFSPPGFYNKKDPRKTELGRINDLQNIAMYKVESKLTDKPLYEIQLTFLHKTNGAKTTLIIGGVNLDDFPILRESEANQGWKNSMGIGNHSFYESYKTHIATKSTTSPYYALILDEQGKWLDSHKVGIDGPIFHFSDEQKNTLHLWILSFERHALVGHYQLKIN